MHEQQQQQIGQRLVIEDLPRLERLVPAPGLRTRWLVSLVVPQRPPAAARDAEVDQHAASVAVSVVNFCVPSSGSIQKYGFSRWSDDV